VSWLVEIMAEDFRKKLSRKEFKKCKMRSEDVMNSNVEDEMDTNASFAFHFNSEKKNSEELNHIAQITRTMLNFRIQFMFVIFTTCKEANEVLNEYLGSNWKVDGISFQRSARIHPSKLEFDVLESNSFDMNMLQTQSLKIMFCTQPLFEEASKKLSLYTISSYRDIPSSFDKESMFLLSRDADFYIHNLISLCYRRNHPLHHSKSFPLLNLSHQPSAPGLTLVLSQWISPINVGNIIKLAFELKCRSVIHVDSTNHFWQEATVRKKLVQSSGGLIGGSCEVFICKNLQDMINHYESFCLMVVSERLLQEFVSHIQQPVILMETFMHEKVQTSELYEWDPPNAYFGVVGSERRGINTSLFYWFLTETNSQVVFIRTSRAMPSLNAAMAASALLFHDTLFIRE